MIYFMDVEADGFLLEATKIHCLSVKAPNSEPCSFTASETHLAIARMRPGDTHVWHNGHGYDIPLLKQLGYAYDPSLFNIIDSLALSREWWPDCPRGHGLEAWAKQLGMKKPTITDWIDGDIEDYMERCEEDVRTTEAVYNYLLEKL